MTSSRPTSSAALRCRSRCGCMGRPGSASRRRCSCSAAPSSRWASCAHWPASWCPGSRPDLTATDSMAPADALRDTRPACYWLDRPDAPEPAPALHQATTADLAVVGGGFTGLWTALLAKERDPGRDVVLLEGRTAGWAASGRNGGFCSASLTHGLRNGLDRFPSEMATLERLGRENLDGIGRSVAEHGIDCSFERTGELTVATAPWQAEELREVPALAAQVGGSSQWLDADAVRAKVDSPTYLGG